MDLLAIGGLALDYMFNVDSLPRTHFAATITEMGRFFGGRAPNVAVMTAALGLKTGIVSMAGNDFQRSGYRSHLHRYNVDQRGIVEVHGEKTTRAFIFTDRTGGQITFVQPGVSIRLGEMKPPLELMKESTIVHVSSCNNLEFEVNAVMTASKIGALVSFDPGNLPFKSRTYAKKLIAKAYFLFMNNVEASAIIKKLGITNVRDITKLGPSIVVVMDKKSKSSKIYAETRTQAIHSVQKRIKYPTGTSDGYIAGFLTGYLKGCDVKTMGLLGAAEASLIGESFGCQSKLPSWNQLAVKFGDLFGGSPNRNL